MKKHNVKKRTPLKEKPLRYAGMSVDQEIERVFDDLMPYIASVGMVVALLFIEWFSWFFQLQRSPIPITVISIPVVAYSAWRVNKSLKKLRALRLGRDGERIVAEQLDSLRAEGMMVVHDVVCDGFNIDHIVVARQGVFTVETKTISKRVSNPGSVEYLNGRLVVGGYEMDRNPITQVEYQSRWLKDFLAERIGRPFPIKPVLMFPGWWVEPIPKHVTNTWILNEKAFAAFVRNQPNMISEDDVKLITQQIKLYVRGLD